MALENENDSKKVSMSVDKYEELVRTKMAQEVKSEVVEWVKRWATVLTITIALIGTIGLNVLVATVVRSFLAEDIKEAQRTSVIATESVNRASIAMERATNAADQYTSQVDELSKRAEKVEGSFNELEATIEGASRSVRTETRSSLDDLQIQVESLNKVVGALMESVRSKSEAENFREMSKKLEEKAISKRSIFETKSKYTVVIGFFGGTNSKAKKLSQALEKAGFQTAIVPNAPKFNAITGVPEKVLLEDTSVLIMDPGQEEIAKSIFDIAETVLGRLNTFKGPSSSTPNKLVLFLKEDM